MPQFNPIDKLAQDVWPAPQPHGGVAPLRYDLAVAVHLAEQAAHRKADVPGLSIWRMVARVVHLVRGGSALPAIVPDQRHKRAA